MIPAQLARPAQPPPGGGDTAGGSAAGGSGLGSSLADPISSMTASAFDAAMQRVWDAGNRLLQGGLTLADDVASIDPSGITGGAEGGTVSGIASLWPSMVWLAAVIALGLFFSQLISVAVRGGRGMFRAFTGPAQFGIAMALTTGAVATLLTAADGLTAMSLSSLSEQGSFSAVLENPTVADRIGPDPDLGDLEDDLRSMLLGLAAFFGTIPAGIGLALLMIFRQAAVLVLIATIPIAAAGLVADTTASIFWRSARWILAAVLMKPALALVLLVGVQVMGRADGVAGLLAGTAVLLVSLSCPIVLHRLLAFVDPGTAAGTAVRSRRDWRGPSEPSGDDGASEAINIARYSDRSHRVGGPAHGGTTAGGEGELGGTTAVPAGAGTALAAVHAVRLAGRPATKATARAGGARRGTAVRVPRLPAEPGRSDQPAQPRPQGT
jgi:hypothetical protein